MEAGGALERTQQSLTCAYAIGVPTDGPKRGSQSTSDNRGKEMATVLAASIAAIVAVTGWFIGHQLTTRRDDRTKRLELSIAHSEKQIGEFYAPLVFLLGQLDTIANVAEYIHKQKKDEGVGGLGEITYREYFLPIHKEIITILKTKIHLLEGGVIPPSLMTYIAHFTSENLAWRLTKENVQIWDFITGFPEEFPDQLKEHQELVYRRYEEAVQELRHLPPAKQPFIRNIISLTDRTALRWFRRRSVGTLHNS
jgi:hypothetical protein